MAISRNRKEELVETYRKQLEHSKGMVFANYSGLSVPQMEKLRSEALDKDGEIFVVKNTLISRVLENADIAPPEGLFSGPVMTAFCHEDVPPLAKLFRDYTKELEEEKFKIKGSFLEGKYLSPEQTLAIADLPGREELLAQVLRTINAPATQIAGTVASGIRQIMNVVQAYVDKLEEGGASAEAAA
ncbi:MAG: 50S ribosomal protein L10 [Anaerolineales bacterium]